MAHVFAGAEGWSQTLATNAARLAVLPVLLGFRV